MLRKLSLYKRKMTVSVRDFGIKRTLLRILEDVILLKQFMRRTYIIYESGLDNVSYPELRNPDLEFSFIPPDDHETMKQVEALSGLSWDRHSYPTRWPGLSIKKSLKMRILNVPFAFGCFVYSRMT